MKNATMKRTYLSRRRFLTVAAATGAAAAMSPTVIPATALGAEDRPAPSNRVVMASIGPGHMGHGDMLTFAGMGDVQLVAVCDVRKKTRDVAKADIDAKYKNTDCKTYVDFRELLERPDIDAVNIATPDHWHAVMTTWACRKGKDVYCQKPESLTIREGRAMVEAARRYNRVVSGGSQRVLEDFRSIVEKCWRGEYGTLKEIYVPCGGPSLRCNLPAAPFDEEIEWDLWLGPAPWAPYHPYRCNGTYSINGTGWRSWQDYSGGGMTDWGAHRFGAAMFMADKRHTGPIEIIPPDGKDHKYLTYVFEDGLRIYHRPDGPMEVIGDNKPLPPRQLPVYRGNSIYADFVASVKARIRPFRDIEYGHRTASVCHLGNIAYYLNRPLKWDPVREEFPGDDQANAFRDRARREPWTI